MDVWSTHISRQFQEPFWFNERTGISTWHDPHLKHRVIYSAKPGRETGIEEPKATLGVRRFHNWIKAVAISRALSHAGASGGTSRVLDLACGRGGDLLKLQGNGVEEYIGIDHSPAALTEAKRRADQLGIDEFQMDFNTFDMRCPLPSSSVPSNFFDMVMCMFGPHFAYSAANHAKCFWDNVRRSLRPGGTFVCIFPSRTAIDSLLAGQRKVERELFSVELVDRDRVIFHVRGSTPHEAEPMVAPEVVCNDLTRAGLHVQFQGAPRLLRARRDSSAPSRAAMRCPERLTRVQWELADLQYVIIASASDCDGETTGTKRK